VSQQTVLLNRRGVSLVEVMIALVVLLLVFMALMQTTLVSINANMNNVLRDEAVAVAEQKIIEVRSMPFGGGGGGTTTATRNVRNIPVTYTIVTAVTADPVNINNEQISVQVTWTWKGQPFSHVMNTMRTRPS